jgi:hypothetical protein
MAPPPAINLGFSRCSLGAHDIRTFQREHSEWQGRVGPGPGSEGRYSVKSVVCLGKMLRASEVKVNLQVLYSMSLPLSYIRVRGLLAHARSPSNIVENGYYLQVGLCVLWMVFWTLSHGSATSRHGENSKTPKRKSECPATLGRSRNHMEHLSSDVNNIIDALEHSND